MTIRMPAPRRAREDVAAWLLITPAAATIVIFTFFPIAYAIWIALHKGFPGKLEYAGLVNAFKMLNDPVFLLAFTNTLIFLVVQVPLMLAIALVIALALNTEKRLASTVFRTAIFLPCITSLVTYSVLFKSMFSYDGIINQSLRAIGLISTPVPWLTDPFYAKLVIVIAITWRWTGYNVIFFLAAIRSIDPQIFEAALIDGAGRVSRFRYITIPLITPTIVFSGVISTIGTVQLFDEPVNITGGGPSDQTLTLSLYVYNLVFKFVPNFGYASMLSCFVMIVALALAYVAAWFINRLASLR